MDLTPSDAEKLLLAVAGMVARDRRERGVKLNRPEAVALLSTWVIERAREGATVAELMRTGTEVLGPDDVMPGVADLVDEVQVEATFPDGRKLVTLHHPIGHRDDGSHAASGSDPAGPGAVRVGAGEIELNADRGPEDRLELVVENTGDRPIQIGSHLHLPDANPALHFDREAAYGFRLDVPSGTSARFEPGAGQVVHAVRLRGAARVPGLQIGKETADGLDRA